MDKIDTTVIKTFLTTTGLNILIAILILYIGLKITKILVKVFDKAMIKKEVDASLRPFLGSLISWVLKVCVFITAVSSVGIQTTSFIALLGSAGLAVGLALQGSLANFAGGVLILLLKPFKVGDVIKAQGFIGTVDKITIFSTILKTGDNQIINIPNGGLASSPITNVNHESTRRVDFTFGIGYDDNIGQAKSVLEKIISEESRILKDPAHLIVVGELADSSINFIVRVWVNTPDYWGVFFAINEKVKTEFDANKISIPYPQTDVHIHQ